MPATGLAAQFARAGLPIKIVPRARDVNRQIRPDAAIFAMDILRSPERFVMHAPDDANVSLVNIDRDLRQAVLVVKEPARRFAVREWDRHKHREVTRWQTSPAEKRHILVGMDECHLFAAPLPQPVSTVRHAHEILAPQAIRERRARGGKVMRQGEWFFVPVTDAETLAMIARRAALTGVLAKARLGNGTRRGRPHVADQKIVIPNKDPKRLGREFARGCIRHPDHHVRELVGWHEVIANTESPNAVGTVAGMNWID